MLGSSIEEVAQHLEAFVDHCVANRVELAANACSSFAYLDGKSLRCLCLMYEYINLSDPRVERPDTKVTACLPFHSAVTMFAVRLGIGEADVLSIVAGWDAPARPTAIAYQRLGSKLYKRFTDRKKVWRP